MTFKASETNSEDISLEPTLSETWHLSKLACWNPPQKKKKFWSQRNLIWIFGVFFYRLNFNLFSTFSSPLTGKTKTEYFEMHLVFIYIIILLLNSIFGRAFLKCLSILYVCVPWIFLRVLSSHVPITLFFLLNAPCS